MAAILPYFQRTDFGDTVLEIPTLQQVHQMNRRPFKNQPFLFSKAAFNLLDQIGAVVETVTTSQFN